MAVDVRDGTLLVRVDYAADQVTGLERRTSIPHDSSTPVSSPRDFGVSVAYNKAVCRF
jgi:hypothetical protein